MRYQNDFRPRCCIAAATWCMVLATRLSHAGVELLPKAAVFPLAGTAMQDEKDKVGFSLRTKIDRDGHFEPIDGPTMTELAGDKPIDLSARADDLMALAKDESPVILIWGELNKRGDAFDLK